MLSRRALIGKAAVGAAAVLAVGGAVGTGVAATRPLGKSDGLGDGTEAPARARDGQQALEPSAEVVAAAAPPAWELVAPLTAGSVVAHGWHLAAMTAVEDGSAVVTLENERGHAHRIHLCANDGTPQGLVYTPRVDLVVMNQGYGALPTEEHFGQAVAALAHVVAANEATLADGTLAGLLPHAARVERFAAVDGPAADGKLR
jgi:hypothetical protein